MSVDGGTQIEVTVVRALDGGGFHRQVIATSYEVGMTVLDVLTQIYREADPTLAFRHSCHRSLCMACLATVDGRQVLTCRHPARDGMVVEPSARFEPIRDLVVDLTTVQPRSLRSDQKDLY